MIGYKIIDIPSIIDDRGGLGFAQYQDQVAFLIKRVYWLYDIKKDRGAHAHKELKQLMICLQGSLKISLDDGKLNEVVTLNTPSRGLYINKPLWRDIISYEGNPILLVLASDIYKETDYIRSYEEFKKWKLNF